MKTKKRIGPSARRRISMAIGAVTLAFGAIVLSRAAANPAAASPIVPSAMPVGPSARAVIETPEMSGFLALTDGAIVADGTRDVLAELRLEAGASEGTVERRPVALALVLDTSGSMMGDKIADARRSVGAVLERMRAGDRVSVVMYNDMAHVVSPLVEVSHAREQLPAWLATLQASGGTNIPAGLQAGASTLNHAPASMIRRLVLISDGIDGSGIALESVQSSVQVRAQGGTTTSALGVGSDYDERWLTTVADAGRGNYEYLARGYELASFLTRELDQASTTVAENTVLELDLPDGWRLAQAYGAIPDGNSLPIGALYAGERRRVTLRMTVDAGAAGRSSSLGASLRFRGTANESDRNLTLDRLSVTVVSDETQVAAVRDMTLHAEALAQVIEQRQALAMDAWRGGRAEEAQRLTRGNLAELNRWALAAPEAADALGGSIEAAEADLGNFESVSASSAEGRGYGLGSNGARRRRGRSY